MASPKGKQLTRNVFEMSTVLQPWATSRDVVGCALALSLDEDREVGGCTVPGLEGLEKLETAVATEAQATQKSSGGGWWWGRSSS